MLTFEILSIERQKIDSLKAEISIAKEAFPERQTKTDWAKSYHEGSRKIESKVRGKGALT